MNDTFYGFTIQVSGVFFLLRARADPNEQDNFIFTAHRLRQFGRPVNSPDTSKFPPTFPFTYVKCNGIEMKLDPGTLGPYVGRVHIDDLQIGNWEETIPPNGDMVPDK